MNPCVPNPCGNFGQCNNVRGSYVCHCLPNYYGSPPYCRPECSVNSDCPNTKSCANERCIDPCPGSCGMDAVCNVINHVPNCACKPGYEGDAFVRCRPIVVAIRPSKRYFFLSFFRSYLKSKFAICEPSFSEFVRKFKSIFLDDEQPKVKDKCRPNPCGSNSECKGGVCSCISDYIGNPYFGCHPECILNTECPRNKACINNKCVDPCVNMCGQEALCSVVNHIPMCDCQYGYTGNAYVACAKIESMLLHYFNLILHLFYYQFMKKNQI